MDAEEAEELFDDVVGSDEGVGLPADNVAAVNRMLAGHEWGVKPKEDAQARALLTLAYTLDSGEATAQHFREYRSWVMGMGGEDDGGIFGADM